MYKIQANEKGSRYIEVSDEHLRILEKFDLLDHLTDSTGRVDEDTLAKLRLTLPALINSCLEDLQALNKLGSEVVFHDDMKALGLKNLMHLFEQWKNGEPII
ncbi:MAG: hypothetical protein J6T82_08625 [Bacteroidaceae bacterium]|nr:hypothetical protein [Bacteroidaceae bacterium]